jgi:hypothetical protein
MKRNFKNYDASLPLTVVSVQLRDVKNLLIASYQNINNLPKEQGGLQGQRGDVLQQRKNGLNALYNAQRINVEENIYWILTSR